MWIKDETIKVFSQAKDHIYFLKYHENYLSNYPS